jgi:hypothetical protein
VLYWSSSRRPDLEAMGVVSDFVVVKASKTKLACSIFLDKGVAEYESRDLSVCPRMVVFPEPDSPLGELARGGGAAWNTPALTKRQWPGPRSAGQVACRLAGRGPRRPGLRIHPCRHRRRDWDRCMC